MRGKGIVLIMLPMESFWGTLKQELIYHCHFRTTHEAIAPRIYRDLITDNDHRQNWGSCPVAYAQSYYAGLLAS
jgi:hypothetical protein